MLVTALKNIAALQPSPLPDVELPRVPDLSAAQPLADMAHGDATQLIAAADLLTRDNATISAVLDQARRLITAAAEDLCSIGTQLICAAAPATVGLLSLDPSARAAALAFLRTVIDEHSGRAMARVNRLKDELTNTAAVLFPISLRPVESAVGLPQQGAATAGSPTGAAPAPELSPAPSSHPPAGAEAAGDVGRAAVAAAKSQLGQPYAWGGTGNGGFDCSGLTQWAYSQAGVDIPRTADQQAIGKQVSADKLQPGDLVVWDGHVAMYSGDGEIVEAGDPVQTNPLRTNNMGMQFKGFWRPTA
ncbi:glycoside hydrolase [Corynebacterium macginleyi]|uniref:C40 family peptidase n=1 Tax=Corynebacterium macginleyi TaxID=38290 RepID=UPI00190BA396|nr:C40 family peptidase [Corynebacterium macginleyi]MBK4142347.1 glycoside hydrolase [Corynebacterium macginleyi]